MKKIITIPSKPCLVNKLLWPTVVLMLLWACSRLPTYDPPEVKGQYVLVSLKDLPLHSPKFYTYSTGHKSINFFVVKTEHSVEAYLDACIKCYPHKKGFRVEGFFIVCRYCGSRYPMDNLKRGLGTCYPIPLKAQRKGDFLYIEISTLKDAERYF